MASLSFLSAALVTMMVPGRYEHLRGNQGQTVTQGGGSVHQRYLNARLSLETRGARKEVSQVKVRGKQATREATKKGGEGKEKEGEWANVGPCDSD